MTGLTEKYVTREQAELLFDIDDSVPVHSRYRLVLMPTNNEEAEPFATDAEVAEFLRWANQKWLQNDSW
jgi:hypothetical protein